MESGVSSLSLFIKEKITQEKHMDVSGRKISTNRSWDTQNPGAQTELAPLQWGSDQPKTRGAEKASYREDPARHCSLKTGVFSGSHFILGQSWSIVTCRLSYE